MHSALNKTSALKNTRRIKIRIRFFLTLAMLITAQQSKSQSGQKIVIQLTMAERSATRIRYANDNFETIPVTFRNQAQSIQVVTKEINVKKPTVFRYSLVVGPNKFSHQFLAFPNDTLKMTLHKNGDITFLDGRKFIEQVIIDEPFRYTVSQLTTKNIQQYYNHIDSVKTANHTLQTTTKEAHNQSESLKLFTDILFYQAAMSPVFNKKITDHSALDALMLDFPLKVQELQRINTIDLTELVSNYISHKLSKSPNQSLTSNIKAVKKHDFGILGNTLIINKLNRYPEKNSSEYLEALNYIDSRALVKEYAVAADILELELLNVDGSKNSLGKELNSLAPGGLIVLDFWATWCAPCISEFPHFSPKIEKLKSKNIVFIGISTDTDDKNDAWITLSKKLAISGSNYRNYRVSDKNKPAFLKSFKLSTIPRYVVINKKARIINNDFERPSSKDFNQKLIKYLTTQ